MYTLYINNVAKPRGAIGNYFDFALSFVFDSLYNLALQSNEGIS